MGLATNRTWVTDSGDKKEETEFHRIVAWNKLAELCSQLLFKGRRVYVEGRLQTRQWTGSDGNQRQATEIVIEDMLVLDSKRQGEEMMAEAEPGNAILPEEVPVVEEVSPASPVVSVTAPAVKVKSKSKIEPVKDKAEEVADDIPF
jgi:single-strand DNA-binding protein